jgi:hypothetical protein
MGRKYAQKIKIKNFFDIQIFERRKILTFKFLNVKKV